MILCSTLSWSCVSGAPLFIRQMPLFFDCLLLLVNIMQTCLSSSFCQIKTPLDSQFLRQQLMHPPLVPCSFITESLFSWIGWISGPSVVSASSHSCCLASHVSDYLWLCSKLCIWRLFAEVIRGLRWYLPSERIFLCFCWTFRVTSSLGQFQKLRFLDHPADLKVTGVKAALLLIHP